MERKKVFRIVAFVTVAIVGLALFFYLDDDTRGYKHVPTSVALAQVDGKNVDTAQIDDKEQRLRLTLKNAADGTDGATEIIADFPAGLAPELTHRLATAAPREYTTHVSQETLLGGLVKMLLPVLLLVGLFVFLMSRMQGSRGGPMGFGRSKAKQFSKDMPQTTFADVAGADEAVAELSEIKDFLQNPTRYQALGAKIPRGVLLFGPPGTGKTLIARAVAGEAGVPFFTISGSDFVEMFVGVGASRVRDMFEQAKSSSPCIIFVDEIDAVGRQRGAGMGGGHDEREQTLNQLLVEMDGFGDRQGIILIAATNRPDVLDPALLRPGRFDRQIPVTNPDIEGRKEILRVHAKNKPIGPDVDLDALARRTVGMSGADLANVLNEAALLTARVDGNVITADALEEATDRVLGGPRRTKVLKEKEKRETAYHEAGHTLAAWASPDIDPVYKVTILPRGRIGGFAMIAGDDDKGTHNRSELLSQIVFGLGGRAAEEYVFAQPTTGASNDIEKATKQARAMVTKYGMSARIGAVQYGDDDGDPFLGRAMGRQVTYSHEIAKEIDAEVRRIIEACHDEAWSILETYRDELDRLAAELMEKETLRRPDLERILGHVGKRPRITVFDEFGSRLPSTRPPVELPSVRAAAAGTEMTDARIVRTATAAPPVVEPPVPPAPSTPTTPPGAGRSPQPPYPPAAPPAPPGAGPAGGMPTYGTPPPPGWSVPGWQGPTPERPGPTLPPGASYGFPEAPAEPRSGAPTGSPTGSHELRGFALPAHEKPAPMPAVERAPENASERAPEPGSGYRPEGGSDR